MQRWILQFLVGGTGTRARNFSLQQFLGGTPKVMAKAAPICHIFTISKLLLRALHETTATVHRSACRWPKSLNWQPKQRQTLLYSTRTRWLNHTFTVLCSKPGCKHSWLLIYFFWVEWISLETAITTVCKITDEGHTDMFKRLQNWIESSVRVGIETGRTVDQTTV